MKRFWIILVILTTSLSLNAQSLVYDVSFFEYFDNREYKAIAPSETIFGAVLSPVIGLQIDEHQVFANPIVVTDLGASNLGFEFAFWYRFRKDHFRLSAGIFPATDSKESWSTLFVSEKQQWYRPYLNGLLFAFDDRNYNYELGLDWRGLYGDTPQTREEFVVFSSGHQDLSKYWTLGYNAFMHHFANSPTIRNVSDDILIEAYANLNLNTKEKFQEFYLKAGFILSPQRDRSQGLEFNTNAGLELSTVIKKWDVKVDNRFYLGSCLQTINTQENLYFGDPFFSYSDTYDRLEIGYYPRLGKYINLNIALVLHFNSLGLVGNQQIIGLTFNLNNL